MSDPTDTPARTGESLDRWGPTAIMSYLSMAIFAGTAFEVFQLVVQGTKIDGLMGALIGSVLTASAQNSQGALNFWTGGNVGAKTASDRLAKLASAPTGGVSAPSTGPQTINVAAPIDPNAPDAPADKTGLEIPPKPETQP